MKSELKIFSGNGNPRLAQAICDYLHLPVGQWRLTRFKDGEIYCQVLENVRGTDVFVIQPTCPPVNENLMELLIAVDGLKRSSAARITAVMPYYGYARQDRKDKPRVPISAKLVADLLQAAGVVPRADHRPPRARRSRASSTCPWITCWRRRCCWSGSSARTSRNLTIVSPDAGGVERARFFAKQLGAALAIIDKRRVDANVAEVAARHRRGRGAHLRDRGRHRGHGRHADGHGARAQGQRGRARASACFTHAVLSGPAMERLAMPDLERVVVTDTIPLDRRPGREPKLTTLSVASLLGEAIARIHSNSSVSSLFV